MKLWSVLTFATTTSAFVAPGSVFRPSVVAAAPASSNSNAARRQPQSQPLRNMLGSILDLMAGGEASMVKPEDALPGRKEKMPNISGSRHYVLGNDLEKVPDGHKVAVFANGCLYVCSIDDLSPL